jgi:hypothetical protein
VQHLDLLQGISDPRTLLGRLLPSGSLRLILHLASRLGRPLIVQRNCLPFQRVQVPRNFAMNSLAGVGHWELQKFGTGAAPPWAAEPNGGLIVGVQPNSALRELISRLAFKHRLPTIYSEKSSMPEGA